MHCLNTELQLPSSGPGGEPRQQGGNLSFAAIDMFAKLVILLVKVCMQHICFQPE